LKRITYFFIFNCIDYSYQFFSSEIKDNQLILNVDSTRKRREGTYN